MPKTCYQINLQSGFGGGEVYTRFFTRALLQLGWKAVLLVPGNAAWWRPLEREGAVVVPVARAADAAAALPAERSLVVAQTPLPPDVAGGVRQRHALACFAHMPLYGRNPEPFRHCDTVFAVSRHVIASLREAGIAGYYPEPLYGVADLARTPGDGTIHARSRYDWDRRKFRDRVLSYLHPLWLAGSTAASFEKRPGLSLGIVSRITPIKQFPHLFEILAPRLAAFPQVKLEIFGSGGYASVRDLERALAPLGARVRWWGHQEDVAAVYRQLDFLLAGLPEKEALGLNVIEAQACGTPVIAVDAPPFDETVLHRQTGRLYADPRRDGGAGFAALLSDLLDGGEFPQPLRAREHIENFSFPRFVVRVEQAMAHAAGLLS